jgi:hypothetical protein
VAIVNEVLAREQWPGQTAVGHRVRLDNPAGAGPWLTVVGVAGDVHTRGPDVDVMPELYVPDGQFPTQLQPDRLLLRTTGPPTAQATVNEVSRVVHEIDPGVPVTEIASMDDIVQSATVADRAAMALMLALAVSALVLAAIGIYSVLSYAVAQQTREIGVRIALGAGSPTILRLCVGGVARLAIVGIALGAVAAWPLTALMKDLLFGVQAGDPVTTGGTMLILMSTAVLAAYIPARRAMRANPADALRLG